MSKNKIAFFGASVTQQTDGYWKYFSIKNKNFIVQNFGHGSMHLNDAGIVFIDDVLKFEPDYCFIDWFSTGYIEYEKHDFEGMKKYIDAILYKFLSNNVLTIFLTFPDVSINSKTNLPVDKKEIYKKLNDYIKSWGIPSIDLSESFDNLSEILRDGIHTTTYGSQIYANIISDEFHNRIFQKIEFPKEFPEKNKYCEVKKLEINSVVNEILTLEGNGEVIGISQTIGPYSGLLNINGIVVNNWDRWCHYERPMVNLTFNVEGISYIKILQDEFDRSSCIQRNNWQLIKFLNLNTLFYVGEEIKIKEKI